MKKNSKWLPEFGRTGKMGTYTLTVIAIMLAALIVVNLLVAALPSKYTAIDTSPNKMYTLSESSVKFVSSVDKDVTLYFVCQGGAEDSKLKTFLERFADLSPKIKVKTVDPIEDSTFLGKYNAEDASNYSVVVVSDARSKLVDYADLNYYASESGQKMSAEEYQSYINYYGEYASYYLGNVAQYFDGDSMITGALEYVTADKIPMVYFLEGHMEPDMSTIINQYLFKASGIESDRLNLAMDGTVIPDDADLIIVNAPANDLTSSEADKLTAYLNKGGKIILITDDGCASFDNLAKVGAVMGLSAEAGIVKEGTSSMHYQNHPEYIYPNTNSSHKAISGYSDFAQTYRCTLLFPSAHSVKITEKEGITATALLTTSDKATSGDSEEKSVKNLCAVAESEKSKLLWFSSDAFLSDTFINATNGGNFYLFAYLFTWMHGNFASALPEISAIELSEPTITVNESQVLIWGALLLVVIPALVFVAGLVYWLYRRKK